MAWLSQRKNIFRDPAAGTPPRTTIRVALALPLERQAQLLALLKPLTSVDPDIAQITLKPNEPLNIDESVDVCFLTISDLPRARVPARTSLISIGAPGSEDPLASRSSNHIDHIDTNELLAPVVSRCLMFAVQRAHDRAALNEAHARHELSLAGANDGMWEWNLRTNQVAYSSRWMALLGLSEQEIEARPEGWLARVHPDDIDGLRASLREHIDGRSPEHEFEHRIRLSDGTFRWVSSHALVRRAPSGEALYIAGSLTDVSRRKRAEAKLHRNVQHDSLTGLASRLALVEELEGAIDRARDDPRYRYVLLFINLNRFKMVNDSIGLESGDRMLAELGARLRTCVKINDLVCRYGGDEFAILVDNLDTWEQAEAIADTIHSVLSESFAIDGHNIFTTASIGVAVGLPSYDRTADVIRNAGVATGQAKHAGVSRTSFFNSNMRVDAVHTLHLQNALRMAVDRREFEVYYQPIVNIRDRVLAGFEALVRWRHPSRGIVGPCEFIPLAEETGLIVRIGHFVLREACAQMATWNHNLPEGADLNISVNLSGRQLESPALLDDIEGILAESTLDPHHLRLEITESTLIDDPESAERTLQRLRSMGIRIYIDDFGTGYSSLTYLHRFSVDGLKIDKSFVDMLGQPNRKSAIVPSIVSLGHNLGMGVIAEGVETNLQANALQDISCIEGQGYLYSRPITGPDATWIIKNGLPESRNTPVPHGSTLYLDRPTRGK